MGNGNQEWDAFKSLEQNDHESSEEEYDSSDEDEGGSRCSENDVPEGQEQQQQQQMDHQPRLNQSSAMMNSDPNVDLVDLVDSSDDDDDVGENDESIDLVDTDDEQLYEKKMPGKENNQSDTTSRGGGTNPTKRKRLQKQTHQYKSYTIDGGDSDSSLSEAESRRPLPSPGASRQLPPWQQLRGTGGTSSRRSTTSSIVGRSDSLKSSDSYSCMSSRNDILGGSGSGVNGFRLATRKGEEDDEGGTKQPIRKSRKSASASASGTRSRKASSSTSTTAASKKTTTRRRKRSTTTKSTTSKAAPARKRKKRSYKRKRSTSRSRTNNNSNAAAGGGRATNNAWSARERGIRSTSNRRGGRRSGGGETGAPYMAIAKQEPMLRNVGGASIQF